MGEDLKRILLAYVCLNVVSLVFSIIFYRGNRQTKAYSLNVAFWGSMVLLFALQAAFQASSTQIVMAFASVGTLVLVIARLVEEVYEISLPKKPYLIALCAAPAVSGTLLATDASFTVAAAPVAFTLALTTMHIVGSALVRSKGITGTARLMLVFILSWAVHLADFPFLRQNPDAVMPAFYFAFIYGFFMSVLVPYVIAEKTNRNYTRNLEEEVRRKTADLDKSNIKLATLARERENITRVVCHDTRNSLQIIAWQQGLLTRELEAIRPVIEPLRAEKIATSIRKATSSVKNLTSLIGNIARFLAADSGKLHLDVKPVRLSDSLKECQEMMSEAIAGKKLKLHIRCDERAEIIADPVALVNTVLANIISNAIKFSRPGSAIWMHARVLRDGRVRLAIKDFGIGIPEAILASLFDSSASTTRPGTLNERGTGFGMPLVKVVLDRFDAVVRIKSRPVDQFPGRSMSLFCIDFPQTRKTCPSKHLPR